MFRSHPRPDPGPQLTPWGFYAVTPTKRPRDPFRMVAIGVALSFVLVLGGCMAVVGSMARELRPAFDVPVAAVSTTVTRVETGSSFILSGFRTEPGWTVDREARGALTIGGLRVSNLGDRPQGVRYAFKFRNGYRQLAEVDCYCAAVAPGETVPMQCLATTAPVPLGNDRILVADSY